MSPAEALAAVRDLVIAGEEAGWDCTDERDALNRGRDAYAALQLVLDDGEDVTGEDTAAAPATPVDCPVFGQISAAEADFCRGHHSRLSDIPAPTPYMAAQLRMEPVRLAYFLALAREIERGSSPSTIASATGALFAKFVSMVFDNIDEQTAQETIAAANNCLAMQGSSEHQRGGMQYLEITKGAHA